MAQLKNFFSVAQVISVLLYPHAEVVVHDLESGLIAVIYNNFSKRKVGDESLIEWVEFPDVFPIYTKVNWDGRKLKSASATLRDDTGRAIGLLCINLDVSKWEDMHQFISQWMHGISPQPPALFKDDWREKINTYVSDYLTKQGVTLKSLSKEKKKQLIDELHRNGAFNAKNAASYVADVLNLSRATIYNYLKA